MISQVFFKAALLAVLVINCSCQKQTVTIKNVTISWENKGNKTMFYVSSPLGNGVELSDCWLGVGINSKKGMVASQIFIFIKIFQNFNLLVVIS
jgi:hypothetical protein